VKLSPLTRSLALSFIALLGAAASSVNAAPFEDTLAQRAMACTGCHGAQGRAAPDGYYPRLAGKPAGYLYHQLLNFREGRRHYGLMTQLLDPLTDAYLFELAGHFASLELPYPPPLPSTVAPAMLARGEQLVRQGDPSKPVPACVQCHGAAMTGVAPNVPGLLGLPRDYLNSQLGAWKSGQRRAHAPDCMKSVVDLLSAEDLNAAASWLAAQPVPAGGKPATPSSGPGPASAAASGTAPLACGRAPALATATGRAQP
jgi:cytochrome c553